MKQHFAIGALAALAAAWLMGGCVAEGTPDEGLVGVGDYLPAFEVDAYRGGDFSATVKVGDENLEGKPLVVVLFNTSCPDCREELPVVQRLRDAYAGRANVLCISRSEGLPSVEAYWRDNGFTMDVSPQEDARVYGLFAKGVIPRVYVCDEYCIVRAAYSDSPVADYATLAGALSGLLGAGQQ